jgi:hypothetical protein
MCPTTCSIDIPLTSRGFPITYGFGRNSSNIGKIPITEKAAEKLAYKALDFMMNFADSN